jgi:hypothetical protein
LIEDEEEKNEIHLQWRDYIAIVIAMFETVLVPVLVVLAVLLALVIVILWA